jgi:16S rRNA (cytosine1402-N4)-methyltransferase
MDRKRPLKASDILNTYDKESLVSLFKDYGEVENAGRLADAIVKGREEKQVVTSSDFQQVIVRCIPKLKEKKYLAQVYQALRIEVNGELEALKEMLVRAKETLRPGGRMVVITYHSLEDRIVKNFFKAGNMEGKVEKDPIYGHVKKVFEEVNRKIIVPSEEEIAANPRARSAKLRVVEKLVES